MKPHYRRGQQVYHKVLDLREATYWSHSKSGKRIGVLNNIAYPWGVDMIVTWFKEENISKERF